VLGDYSPVAGEFTIKLPLSQHSIGVCLLIDARHLVSVEIKKA